MRPFASVRSAVLIGGASGIATAAAVSRLSRQWPLIWQQYLRDEEAVWSCVVRAKLQGSMCTSHCMEGPFPGDVLATYLLGTWGALVMVVLCLLLPFLYRRVKIHPSRLGIRSFFVLASTATFILTFRASFTIFLFPFAEGS